MGDLDPGRGRLAARLVAEGPAKIAVWLGLAAGICIPYFTLQQLDLGPPHSVPITPVDRWVALEPRFLWAYLSLGALVPLAPLLASDRRALHRYALGLALLCLPCFVVFALYPVAGPRPPTTPDHPLFRWLVSVDRPTNSMPSLHAGLTVYSLLFAWRVVRDDLRGGLRAAAAGGGALWGALILYATLATKQHWFLDLPAGALLAVGAYLLSWRGTPPSSH